MEVSKVLTAAEVAEIRTRAEKATPANQLFTMHKGEAWRLVGLYAEADNDFDYASRTDIPALCESHAQLERENGRLKKELAGTTEAMEDYRCKKQYEFESDVRAFRYPDAGR